MIYKWGYLMNITKTELISMGCDPEHAEDWLSVRKTKKKPLTRTALKRMISEAEKAGITLAQAVQICAEEAWLGFKAEYIANRQKQQRESVSLAMRNIYDTSW